jgi:hypothetical protein
VWTCAHDEVGLIKVAAALKVSALLNGFARCWAMMSLITTAFAAAADLWTWSSGETNQTIICLIDKFSLFEINCYLINGMSSIGSLGRF